MLAHDPASDMRNWVDAFTVYMEAQAAAATNPQMLKAVRDAVTQLASAVATETDPEKLDELRKAHATQQSALDTLLRFDLDAFREIQARWRTVRNDLLQTSWDLRERVTFEATRGGFILYQRKKGDSIYWGAPEAQLGIAFFRWLEQTNQTTFDPIEHTKRMLLAQDITADNFHLHADKLAISNPWNPTPTIIKP